MPRIPFLPVFLLVLPLACAGNSAGTGNEQARLEVNNRSSSDRDIYILRNAQRTRLGIAPSDETTRFSLPPSLLGTPGSVQFEAVPFGGGIGERVVSEPVHVFQGDVITLDVPPP